MPQFLRHDFVQQVLALFAAFVLVHVIYIGVVRPSAQSVLEAQQTALLAGDTSPPERSFWVVIKDYEQESCFVLMLWALAIMGIKAQQNFREQQLLKRSFVELSEGERVLPEDARALSRRLEALPSTQHNLLLPRALNAALQRLETGAALQQVAASVRETCETESQRLDTELSMIRYIAWAIPSIGFIGTVRGIGTALGNAQEAVAGDISGVTAALGVAFNSTFIALLISIVLVFISHQLTLHQERLVLAVQNYCDVNLIRHVRV